MFAVPGVVSLSIAAARMHRCLVDFVHGTTDMCDILPFPSLALTMAMWSMLQFTEQLPRKWASGREGCTGARTTYFARPDGSSRAQGLSAVFDA
jgi:hypothetical protein